MVDHSVLPTLTVLTMLGELQQNCIAPTDIASWVSRVVVGGMNVVQPRLLCVCWTRPSEIKNEQTSYSCSPVTAQRNRA